MFHTTISDHDLVYCGRKKGKSTKCATVTRSVRVFKNTSLDDVRKAIKEAPWWIFQYCSTASKKCEMFHAIMKHILDIHAPVKKCHVKVRPKLWMNATYENLSRKAHQTRKAFQRDPTENTWKIYKEVRNKVTRNVIKTLAESDPSSKKVWGVFNQEIGKSKQHTSIGDLIVKGKRITNNKLKLDELAKHFTQNKHNIQANVSLPNTSESPNENIPTLETLTVTSDEVMEVIKNMPMNKPCGSDGLPMKLFKHCALEVAHCTKRKEKKPK